MVVLTKEHRRERKSMDDKIMEMVLAKNITYLQAKEIIESNQSSLSDFKFR